MSSATSENCCHHCVVAKMEGACLKMRLHFCSSGLAIILIKRVFNVFYAQTKGKFSMVLLVGKLEDLVQTETN